MFANENDIPFFRYVPTGSVSITSSNVGGVISVLKFISSLHAFPCLSTAAILNVWLPSAIFSREIVQLVCVSIFAQP